MALLEKLSKEIPRVTTAALGAYAMHKTLSNRRRQKQSQERLTEVKARALAAQRLADMRARHIQKTYQESRENKAQIAKLQREAMRDSKFPIYGNTAAYFDLFTHLSRASYSTHPPRADDPVDESIRNSHALVLIDLDKFKQYNDTHGHGPGDEALETIGKFLNANVRENDLVFRQGGDELGVVLRHTSQEAAADTADGLRIGIRDLGLGDITASMGMTMLDLGQSAKANLTMADSTLYVVKNNGRNNLAIYDPTLNSPRLAA